MSSDAPYEAPFCRVVLVVQPRDGATPKITKSDEHVFHPLNLFTAEIFVLRGLQFENRGTRYGYLTQYNIETLIHHDALMFSRSIFSIQNWVSCVGCESGNASSAEAGPTCESGNASSAQGGPTYFNSSGVVQRGIDHFGSEALSKAASTSPSSDWAAPGSAFGGAPGYGSPGDLQIMNPRALESLHMFRPQGLAFSVHAVGQVVYLQTYSLSILFLNGDA